MFYSLDEGFGASEKRASGPHPDGPQSYCYRCRDRGAVPVGIRCADVEQAELDLVRAVPPRVRKSPPNAGAALPTVPTDGEPGASG